MMQMHAMTLVVGSIIAVPDSVGEGVEMSDIFFRFVRTTTQRNKAAMALSAPSVLTSAHQGTTVKVVRFSNRVLCLALQTERVGVWVQGTREGADDFDTIVLLGERESSLFPQLVARRAMTYVPAGLDLVVGFGLAAPLDETAAFALADSVIAALKLLGP